MYLINTTVTVSWVLQPTGSPLAQTDYDVLVTPPNKSATYTDDGLTSYTAPSATAQGGATLDLLLDTAGLWTVRLADGTNTAYNHQTVRYIYCVQPNFGIVRSQRKQHLDLP